MEWVGLTRIYNEMGRNKHTTCRKEADDTGLRFSQYAHGKYAP
jgi:hypothetical protein